MSHELFQSIPSTGRWTATEGEAAVAAWRISGQSRAAWCRAHSVAPHRLTYWVGVTNPKTRGDEMAKPHFTEVRCAPTEMGESLIVLCDSGARVVVNPGVDVAFLRSVVEALS